MTDIANEPDDQMSVIRFLLYSNQWDVEGLVATTSTWMKAKVRPDVILTLLDAYEKVQPNLLKHAKGYPTAASLRVKRELEGGWFQWIAMPLPALLTIQSGINQLRYATLKGIMAAKKKEIRKAALPDGLQPAQQIVGLAVPTRSKQTQMINGSPADAAKELVRRLREEARAL